MSIKTKIFIGNQEAPWQEEGTQDFFHLTSFGQLERWGLLLSLLIAGRPYGKKEWRRTWQPLLGSMVQGRNGTMKKKTGTIILFDGGPLGRVVSHSLPSKISGVTLTPGWSQALQRTHDPKPQTTIPRTRCREP